MPLVEVSRASKAYWRARVPIPALRNVDLSIAPGEFVAIYGASRSGKSTLLKVLAGLIAPDNGTVTFDGSDIYGGSAKQLARYRLEQVGCVWTSWQSVTGFGPVDHITLPLLAAGESRKSARRRATELMVELEIESLASARLDELAEGERARVALAHALIRRPRLLLADEPVSAVNLIEQDQILALLQRQASDSGTSVVVTATDANQVLRAERVLSINSGSLLSASPPEGGGAEVLDIEARRHRDP